MIRVLRGIPFVYDIQDLWPDSLEATGMIRSKRILGLVARWCSIVYRFASSVVVLSSGFKERLISRGVPENKIRVIYNWSPDQPATPTQLSDEAQPFESFAGKFNVVFAGNMGPAQALDCVLIAAERIKDIAPDVQFNFIGSGISVGNLQDEAARRNLGNVRFLPRVNPVEAARYLQCADALLVHLKDDPLFSITIPSKTQAYLAAGKPILIGVRGDAAQLIEAAGAGIAFTPEDPNDLVSAVERLRRLSPVERQVMGRNGRDFYYSKLSRETGVSEFESVFTSVLQHEGTVPGY